MKKYGLLGAKLSHSFSPQIHSYFYKNPYELFEIEAEKVEEFVKGDNFSAINVTIPYKKTVIPFCAELSDTAKRLGSVNVLLKKENGSLFGDNTDYYGFLYMAEKAGISFAGKKVLVLGSGGSSAMVQCAASDRGAREIVVISRSGENNYENISKHFDADIIVNTTPVGMYPANGEAPIELENFKNCKGVLDLIYNPSKTALLLKAEENGTAFSNGLSMLVAQAKRAAEIFTGEKYNDEIIDKITEDISFETKNIVLIGMPGSGKSTVGKLLAKKIDREFLDTDEIIAEKFDLPANIIKEKGEAEFRKIETDVLKDACKMSGKVIATGGGAVTREENYNIIKQNSIVVFLNRHINRLETKGRPLSQREGIEKLYESRIKLYKKFADKEIAFETELPDEIISKIKEILR